VNRRCGLDLATGFKKEGSTMHKGAVLLFALAFAGPALAQHDHHRAPGATAVAPMAQGEVRKVDKAAKTVTLKHGPIASVDMPPMTMAFGVTDPKQLEPLQPGDKVRFTAEKRGDLLVVTRIDKAKD
jgi:Cu/Ag efflux protein CusF